MPADRVIRWEPPAVAPSADDLGALAKRYTRGLAVSVECGRGRWYVTLPGDAYAAIPGREFLHDPGQRRIVEVWRDDESVYVMTRFADEVTSAIAEGLAALIARHYGGTRDD